MKRTLLLSGAAVVIVLLGALWLLYSSLDFVVKEAIEKYGSQATGTSVRVASVSISLTSGRGTLRGVRIANPPGFSSGDAFAFGEVTLEIDVGTVTDDPVVINLILVDSPEVNYEVSADLKSNIDVIKSNVERFRGGEGGGEGGEGGGEGTSKRLRIREFTFQNGMIDVTSQIDGQELTIDLPEVRLTDIGGPNGVPLGEIGKTILQAFGGNVTRSVSRQGIERIFQDQLGGEAGKVIKGILGGREN